MVLVDELIGAGMRAGSTGIIVLGLNGSVLGAAAGAVPDADAEAEDDCLAGCTEPVVPELLEEPVSAWLMLMSWSN